MKVIYIVTLPVCLVTLQVLVAPLFVLLLCSLVLASPVQVGDAALKAFAQGPNQLTLNYDGEPRPAEETSRFHKLAAKLPKKRGSIVDGKLIPFSQ